MTTPKKGRLSPAATGWVLALLFGGLAAFMLIPWPKREKPEPAPMPYVKPPSKLVALGLPDNPDLELLPEMFAKFASRAEWKNDKTVFAYWHPGVQRYEYYFEATRADGKYRFRAIPEPNEDEYDKDESPGAERAEFPIRRYYRLPEVDLGTIRVNRHPQWPEHLPPPPAKTRPEIMKPPPLELHFPPLDLEQKK